MVNNPLYKHKMMDHPEEQVEFQVNILRKFKEPLTRLANEGVRICAMKPNESLNSKSEFHQPAIVRLQIDAQILCL